MNFTDALQRVNEIEGSFQERNLNTSAVRFEPGAVMAGDVRLCISQVGLSRVCNRIGAPSWYLNKLAPEPQGSPQNRPTKVTSKPANEGGPGPGCFTATCRDRASLFWYANSVGHT